MRELISLVFRLYLYADLTKKIHYATEKSHIHKLCDEVRLSLTDFADNLAEQIFGFYGRPSKDLFPKLSSLDISDDLDLSGICMKTSEMVELLRQNVSSEPKLSGVVSLIDDFKGQMAKYMFLATFDNVANA